MAVWLATQRTKYDLIHNGVPASQSQQNQSVFFSNYPLAGKNVGECLY